MNGQGQKQQANSKPESTGSSGRPRRNLRSLLVEPFKQIKFGLYVIGISVAFVVACAGMFVVAFREQYQHVMSIFNVVDPNQQWDLVTNEVFRTNAIRIGFVFVAYLVVLFGVVFRLTHRYYGPLVSVERFVNDITEGRYNKRATIRTNDELQRLVARLNRMAETLERRHGKDCSDGTRAVDDIEDKAS